MNDRRSELIASLKDRKLTPPPTGTNPYELARNGYQYNALLAQRVLGNDHPLSVYLEGTLLRKSDQYVDVTKTLLEDAKGRWDDTTGLNKSNTGNLLVNAVNFDVNRFGYLSAVESIAQTLKSGQWDGDGTVNVAYQTVNKPEIGNYAFSSAFAHVQLGFQPDSKLTYQAFRDNRVPWLYLYAGKLGDWAADVGQIQDVLASLYQAKPFGLNEEALGWFSVVDISRDTRDELSRCGAIVLNPRNIPYTAEVVRNSAAKGVFTIPLPSIYRGERLQTAVFDSVTPQLELMTSIIGDSRCYDNAPVSAAVLEARAFCKQIDFYERTNQSEEIPGSRVILDTYLGILKGSLKPTVVEKEQIRYITSTLGKLTQPQQHQLSEAIAS